MNKTLKTALIHVGLFLITCVTTTIAGAQFVATEPDLTRDAVFGGMIYAAAFLFILSVHEFGHYFTAVHNRIKTSLPYFIPLPPGFFLGTMGAVIRIREIIRSKREHFDIGIAGPIAGFIAAIVILTYGFTHLPPLSYVDQFHTFMEPGASSIDIVMGRNLIFMFFENFVADPSRIPPPNELIHYPLLFAGFFSLVFTSLNLLPIGQLDGGHVLYGLVGYENHRKVASVVFAGMLFFAGLGFVNMANSDDWYWKIPVTVGLTFYGLTGLRFPWQQMMILALLMFIVEFAISTYFPNVQGYPSWGLFLLILRRFVGIEHPQALIEEPLSQGRKLLGWLALVIFILCLTPAPVEIIESIPSPTHGV